MTTRVTSSPFVSTTYRPRRVVRHPLAPARGIAVAILLALPLWMVIIALVRAVA